MAVTHPAHHAAADGGPPGPLLAARARGGPYALALRATLPAAALCWLVLLALPNTGWIAPLCAPAAAGTFDSLASSLRAQLALGAPSAWLRDWMLMVGAMMLPLAISPLHFLAQQSFPRQRVELTGWWLLGFLAVWLAAAGLAIPAILLARAGMAVAIPAVLPVLLAYGGAIAWQLSGAKQQALARCHATPPLRPLGVAARLDAARFGLGYGSHCAGSCLPAMIAAMIGGLAGPQMLVLFAILSAERHAMRPGPALMRNTAWILAGLGAVSLVTGAA